MVENRSMEAAGADIRWVPVWIAAKRLRVTPSRVYQLIHAGELVAMRSGKTWLVAWQSVQGRDALKRERQVTESVSR